jgi:hypothetical protein
MFTGDAGWFLTIAIVRHWARAEFNARHPPDDSEIAHQISL